MSHIDSRSLGVRKNVIATFFIKGISILISLQVVPMTINYINPTRYGIWLTLSSIIAWLAYFDLGFGNGFRNKFAESVAANNHQLAKKYVSTTYAMLGIVFTLVFIIAAFINKYIDWAAVLKVENTYTLELRVVFLILACFFCLNFVCTVFTTMLTADQKPALSSLITTGGQLFAFITIYILTKTTEGSLENLAFAYSGIPCLFLLIISIIFFCFTSYKKYAPSIKCIDFSLAKSVLKLGVEFFLIMISILFIFQCINIILSRQVGALAVTQYNIAYKYMQILYMVFGIVISPIWSAVTNAYAQNDMRWIASTKRKLEKISIIFIIAAIMMVVISPIIYKYWIGDSVQVSLSLTASLAIYVIAQILSAMYMHIINGIGKLRVQLITYLPFAILSIPLMSFACKNIGVEGVVIVPALTFITMSIVGNIQLGKIINGTATGIWLK